LRFIFIIASKIKGGITKNRINSGENFISDKSTGMKLERDNKEIKIPMITRIIVNGILILEEITDAVKTIPKKIKIKNSKLARSFGIKSSIV